MLAVKEPAVTAPEASSRPVVLKEPAFTAPAASTVPVVLKDPAITFTAFKLPSLRVVLASYLNKPSSL